MAETTQTVPTPAPEDLWQSAVRAMLGPAANLSAVALICVMFYQGSSEQQRLCREDRAAYREDLRMMHSDSQRQWEAIAKTQAAVEDVARVVREQQAATQQLVQALQALTAEVRDLKTARVAPRE